MNFNFTPQRQEVKIPEWNLDGKKLFVAELTGAEYFRYENMMIRSDDKGTCVYSQVAVAFAQNEDGSPFFRLDQAESLSQGNSKPLRRIFDCLAKLNSIDDKTVEELEKNAISTANAE